MGQIKSKKGLRDRSRQQGLKIVLTGGHAGATAYALIQELRGRKNISRKIHWIGARRALEGKDIPTFEQVVFPKIGVKFLSIFTGRIQRKFTFWTIPSLAKIPFGFVHGTLLLMKIKPDVLISFGGFAAYPVVVAAWLQRIPVVIHEQTVTAGRANRYSSYFANKIALSRAESKKYFPPKKCVITGNPVSCEIASIKPKESLGVPPVLFITGGSRGSVSINNLVDKILEKLLGGYRVIHQTGRYQQDKFKKRKRGLRKEFRKNYEVQGFLDPWEWFEAVRKADLLVSRAGANVVSEIIVTKRPSILIPLPIAYRDEQRKNAVFAEKFGVAKVVDQKGLSPKRLLDEINRVKENWNEIVDRIKEKESPDKDAAKKLADLIEEVVG